MSLSMTVRRWKVSKGFSAVSRFQFAVPHTSSDLESNVSFMTAYVAVLANRVVNLV